MKVVTEQTGLRVCAMEPGELPGQPLDSAYLIVVGGLQVELAFRNPHGDPVAEQGITEEACVAILLHRAATLIQREPCDDYNRALYHLVKAQECFKHHHQ